MIKQAVPYNHLRLVAALAMAIALAQAPTPALASAVVTDVNGSATPGNFVFGPSNIGWLWTAPTSFTWDGLGSTFHSCCEFNVLSPSQAVLTIATNVPALGGTTLYSGAVDSAGHSSFAGISVTAGTSYFIGYSNLTGNGIYAVGVNITNWVPAQPAGTVNLSGWYTGTGFQNFFPQSVVGGVQQQPFSAPILRFEGVTAAVPEPTGAALLLAGVASILLVARRRR